MSIQKMTRGPMILIGREFNIPVSRAEKQMYLCIDVSEMGSSSAGKDYNIMLSEVKGLSYSVPERVDINMFIPTNGQLASLHMVEVDPKRGDIELAKTITAKEHISSLAGLKEVLYNMAKTM